MEHQQNMPNQMMMNDSNEMMMHQMQLHHTAIYVFDVLVLIGLATVVVLLSKVLKELRKR